MTSYPSATAFSGALCGRRYEKELETHFRDCLLFYLDGDTVRQITLTRLL